jgi:hypothetical protein
MCSEIYRALTAIERGMGFLPQKFILSHTTLIYLFKSNIKINCLSQRRKGHREKHPLFSLPCIGETSSIHGMRSCRI